MNGAREAHQGRVVHHVEGIVRVHAQLLRNERGIAVHVVAVRGGRPAADDLARRVEAAVAIGLEKAQLSRRPGLGIVEDGEAPIGARIARQRASERPVLDVAGIVVAHVAGLRRITSGHGRSRCRGRLNARDGEQFGVGKLLCAHWISPLRFSSALASSGVGRRVVVALRSRSILAR